MSSRYQRLIKGFSSVPTMNRHTPKQTTQQQGGVEQSRPRSHVAPVGAAILTLSAIKPGLETFGLAHIEIGNENW